MALSNHSYIIQRIFTQLYGFKNSNMNNLQWHVLHNDLTDTLYLVTIWMF